MKNKISRTIGLLFIANFFPIYIIFGQNPGCQTNFKGSALEVSFSDFEMAYQAVKAAQWDVAAPIPDFTTVKSTPIAPNEVSIHGIYVSGDKSYYTTPTGVLSKYITSIEGYGYPRKHNYKVWGIALDKATIEGGKITFNYGPDLFPNAPPNMTIDFGDGYSEAFPTTGTTSKTIVYNSRGIKDIRLYWTETGPEYCYGIPVTTTHEMVFKLEVVDYPMPPATGAGTVYANKEVGSGTIGAQYMVYPGSNNFDIDKPIVIVPGYDFLNAVDPDAIIKDLMFYSKETFDSARAHGYDLVQVKYLVQNDFIQNNAQGLKEVLRTLQRTYPSANNYTILGVSMGGVVSRIALKQMEDSAEVHLTNLFISYDAPHNGANVPLGLQKLVFDLVDSKNLRGTLDFIGKDKFLRSMKSMNTEIHSNAAKQLLIRHINGDQLHTDFQNYLNNLGFPDSCRNVALVSGSKSGITQNVSYIGGSKIFAYGTGDNSVGTVELDAWSAKTNTTQQLLCRSKFTQLWQTKTDRKGHYDSGHLDLDHAPGGFIDVGDGLSLPGFKNDGQKFCFVPVASSCGIDTLKMDLLKDSLALSYVDFFSGARTITGSLPILKNNNLIPFDEVYGSNSNTFHVILNKSSNRLGLEEVVKKEIINQAPEIIIAPSGGQYGSPITVNVSVTDDFDNFISVHYTVDGSIPNASSPSFINTGSIHVDSSQTLIFKAWDSMGKGVVTTPEAYQINQAPKLSFSLDEGSFNAAIQVRLDATHDFGPSNKIYYTLDESQPTTSSNYFTSSGELSISKTTTVKAFALDHFGLRSSIVTKKYTINQAISCNTSYPYIQGFDTEPGNSNAGCGSTVTIASADWANPTDDDDDWKIRSGSTPSNGTGPSSDHSGSGYYLYAEASNPCGGNTVHLESPCFDLSGQQGLSAGFWYHMNGVDMGSLLFQASKSSGPWSTLQTITGNQGSAWINFDLDIPSAYYSDDVKFRFVAKLGAGYRSDIAIDDFKIAKKQEDQGVTVYFKRPTWSNDVPKVHHWNTAPNIASSSWPGKDMVDASGEKGADWFKISIPNATSTCLLFHYNNGGAAGYKFDGLCNVTGGCFDANLRDWVPCVDNGTAPVVSLSPEGGDCPLTVKINASDVDGDVDKIYYTTNGADPSPASLSAKLATNGQTIFLNNGQVLKVRAYDLKGNTSVVKEAKCTVAGAGLTVYFKRPIWSKDVPKIHHWNTAPNIASSSWPGKDMVDASGEKGADWFKYTIPNASSTSMLFHYKNGGTGGYKTPNQNNITGGCYDMNQTNWVPCVDNGTAPVVTLLPSSGDCPLSVKITATDVNGDLDKIYYTTNGAIPGPNSGFASIATNGQTVVINSGETLRVVATDLKNNTSVMKEAKCSVNNGSAPVVSLSPSSGNCPLSVNITATDVDGDLDKIYYTKNGSEPIPTTNYTFLASNGQTVSLAATDTKLRVKAYDTKGNTSVIKEASCTDPNAGLTVYFKRPTWSNDVPKVHHWNTAPNIASSSWPGKDMIDASVEKGADWFKIFIPNATSTSLLFHYNNGGTGGYKTPNQNNVSGGCYDMNQTNWVPCVYNGAAPVISLSKTSGDCPLNVTVSATDADGDLQNIYYTKDGSEPIPTTPYTFLATNGQTVTLGLNDVKLRVKAYDVKGNTSIKEATCSDPNAGLTVYFKRPTWSNDVPKIHHWNTAPSLASSSWPGKNMVNAESERGTDWFKYTIPNATSTSCLFHYNNGGNGGYKTPNQNNITGGCYDMNQTKWISCPQPAGQMAAFDLEYMESGEDLLITQVAESEMQFGLIVYPNPASSQFTITGVPIGTGLNVTDVLGRSMWMGTMTSNTTLVGTASWPAGIYLIQSNSAGLKQVQKVMIR